VVGGTGECTAGCRSWISPKAWGEICRVATLASAFKNLPNAISEHLDAWREVFDASDPQNVPLPGAYAEELTDFDKLLVIRMLRPDKLIPSVCKNLAECKNLNLDLFLVSTGRADMIASVCTQKKMPLCCLTW
jgi:hypothetical protein